MNPLLIKQGLSVARQLRKSLKQRGEEKARGFYDELRESSLSIDDLRDQLAAIDNDDASRFTSSVAARRQQLRAAAGPVAQASHVRLENAKKRLAKDLSSVDLFDFDKTKKQLLSAADAAADATKDNLDKGAKKSRQLLTPWRKKVKKQSKKVTRAAAKTRARAEKKARATAKRTEAKLNGKKSRSRWGFKLTLLFLAVIGIAGAIYRLIANRTAEPGQQPPRVEEFAGKDTATLVHSSTSESEAAGEKAHDDLIGSIDEQLAKLRNEESSENEEKSPTATPKNEDKDQVTPPKKEK